MNNEKYQQKVGVFLLFDYNKYKAKIFLLNKLEAFKLKYFCGYWGGDICIRDF
ncbi:hypothetical protein N752_14370 [Desulforamulus aquiferis]|nr:hypothetical protein N752_14370 [Desulforamulus aquiferis]